MIETFTPPVFAKRCIVCGCHTKKGNTLCWNHRTERHRICVNRECNRPTMNASGICTERQQMTDLGDHCRQAAALVSTWPAWKRNVLGEYPTMSIDASDEMVQIQVETAVFINLEMSKLRAARMTKESLCDAVQGLLDGIVVYDDKHHGVSVKEIGCKWDNLPPDELDITEICNDDFPLISDY